MKVGAFHICTWNKHNARASQTRPFIRLYASPKSAYDNSFYGNSSNLTLELIRFGAFDSIISVQINLGFFSPMS